MPDKTSNELAEERTEKAENRTELANERTFAGWARTAFASIGLGLGFQAIFKTTEPTWVAKAIASLFICLGIWIVWKAANRADNLLPTGEDCSNIVKPKSFRKLAIGITIGAVSLLAALWFLV